MDLFSRKIIAWTLSDNMEVSCVLDTVNKAKARRNTDQPLILHSDRGASMFHKLTAKPQRSFSLATAIKVILMTMPALNPSTL